MNKAYIFLATLIGMIGCSSPEEQVQANTKPTKEALIERGRYLTTIGACNDCHTPKIFDEKGMRLDDSRLLSGHPESSSIPEIDPKALQPGYWILFNDHFTAAVGPWGKTYARNLTPHATGIKGWTLEVFKSAIRTGQHMGIAAGRPIMPPMPWENLKDASDEDLEAIFMFLQSLPPVNNYVPEPVPASELAMKI